ncbi:hypothetical protein GCM10010470_38170 [Saccharopolyspora taberi]|uniref:Uncharacterized protein n=1 Tax=Saccharopolyspora taberi TaxID=60895 RepID=A0ABN3VIA9_9PSEU
MLGGYAAAPRAIRRQWQDAATLPPWLVTASECLTGAEHGSGAAWYTDRAEAAGPGTTVLAVGFDAEDAADLLREVTGDPLRLLAAGTAMPDDARLWGFEVVGVEGRLASLHSWLCHGYEAEVASELGIRPNTCGLLDTHEQASQVVEWMLELPAEQAPAPVYWTVAALAECGAGGSGAAGPGPAQPSRSLSLKRA